MIAEFAEALQTHVRLGGAITPEAVRSCAVGAHVTVADWLWLASTEDLQRTAFGHDPAVVREDTERLAASMMRNSFAAIIEIAEASVEYSWKDWATDEPFVNRQRILEELVDTAHFVANMLVNLGVTDVEWQAAYTSKQKRNRERQASKTYSAKKGTLGEGSEA